MPKIVYTQPKGLFQTSSDGAVFAIPASGSDAPGIAFTDGSGSIAGTDAAGIITVSGAMSAANTITVTFAEAHETTPVILVQVWPGGNTLTNIAVTSCDETGFVMTASGATSTGTIHYLVIAQA